MAIASVQQKSANVPHKGLSSWLGLTVIDTTTRRQLRQTLAFCGTSPTAGQGHGLLRRAYGQLCPLFSLLINVHTDHNYVRLPVSAVPGSVLREGYMMLLEEHCVVRSWESVKS